MTEDQWLELDNPQSILTFLRRRASQRKARLFACACLRRSRYLLTPRYLRAVEISESYADAQISAEEIAIERAVVHQLVARSSRHYRALPWSLNVQRQFARRGVIQVLEPTSDSIFIDARGCWVVARSSAEAEKKRFHELVARCSLLRDLFGNPFRPAIIDPVCLTWNDAAVVRLAQASYDERILPAGTLDNVRLAVLADALEEAGCTDEQILTHLRSGGEHYRGCFVIDALLGKT
jgi:hypothetical protein